MNFNIVLVVLAYLILPTSAFGQAYYIDPANGNDESDGTSITTAVKTLFKARNLVRTANKNMKEDITIYLKGGIYQLDSTFTLTKNDGGTNGHNIVYRPYDCDQKPIVSGGIKITNWGLFDRQKNIYSAKIDEFFNSRQLYVNGARAIRARSRDAAGWAENGDGYDCPEEIANWKNIPNIEVVSYMVWKCHRGSIASVINGHASMAQPYWDNLHMQYSAPPVWIENAYELLDDEGEWYLDPSDATLYYKPRANDNMQTAEIFLAKQETLVNCVNVRNIEFSGITFAHATWLAPNNSKGFACLQADAHLVNQSLDEFDQMPGNIILESSSNIKINSCSFEHLGSTALQLARGCKNNLIYNNTFNDVSGSGISVGSLKDSFPSFENEVLNNVIDNNLISKVAKEFQGSVGIFVGYTVRTQIVHNEIRNLPYTGISMGWGWSNTETISAENEIGFNLLDSVMTVLQDGGGIYTLSAQRGTKIHHNYIKNELNEHAALYVDEGSSYIHFHHNVLNKVFEWINLWSTTSLNDTVEFNYYDNPDNIFSGTGCIIRNNVYVENNSWPGEAIQIMKNAGRRVVNSCNFTWPSTIQTPVTVFPIPTSGTLHILISEPLNESYRLEIFDTHGHLLKHSTHDKFENRVEVDLKTFSPGFYLLRISGERVYYKKLIKI